uniref:Uncharacterized protein n=1 Tax=Rhizophora mucronata TaxID=61149 RepID=A0A2P2N6M2_RHIMU
MNMFVSLETRVSERRKRLCKQTWLEISFFFFLIFLSPLCVSK